MKASIPLAVALLCATQAEAKNPFEEFFGTYEVTQSDGCEPNDSWCKNLKKIQIAYSTSKPGTVAITETGLSGATQTTLLIELPCSNIINCSPHTGMEGV